MTYYFKFFFILSALFQTLSYGATEIDIRFNNHTIGEYLSVFEDPSGQTQLRDVTQLPSDAFKPLNKKVDSHLFTDSVYWYRFDAVNSTVFSQKRVIFFEIPWLDDISIHIIDPKGTISHYAGGDIYPYDVRSYPSNYSNFEHDFSSGTSTVFIRVQTRDPFVVPISLSERYDFLQYDAKEWGNIVFIYGIVVAMILYNLFLYFSIKSRYYFYYVLYISFFVLMNLSYKCYTFGWFFENSPVIQNWMESTTIYLFSISGLFFSRSFLGLKNFFPNLYRTTNAIIMFYVAAMVILFFVGYHYHVATSIFLSMIFSLYALFLGLYTFYKGNRFALFFIVGTTAGLIGTSVTALTVMGLIPYRELFFQFIDYGIVIDTILLSLALGERVKNAQREKCEAILLANTDPLTELPNRRAYTERVILETSRCNRYDTPMSLAFVDIDYFKSINDTHGHVVGDIMLKHMANTIKSIIREHDHVFRIGGEEFILLLPNTALKEAYLLAERLRMEIQDKTFSYGDTQLVMTVSIGISEYIPNEPIHETEKRADACLYQAKNTGRNRTSFDSVFENGDNNSHSFWSFNI